VAGSVAVGFRRVWALMLFFGLFGALLLSADRAAADGEGEDTPPQIVSGSVTPSYLPASGGNVQIQAEIVDDVGVHMTTAQVYGSDGSYQAIQLYEGYTNNYFGTIEVPPNYSDSSMSYSVEVQAYDTYNAWVNTTIGEIQVEGQPQFDEAPWISFTEMNPTVLPAEGGTVTIAAEAGDNRGLSAVYAAVTGPGGSYTEVGLNGVSSSRFEGTFSPPANSGTLAAEYVVEVVVQDDIGQESRASAGIVTVEAPPPAPSAGQLEIWPGDRSFGSVAVGKEAQRKIFVRNLPQPGAEPVSATARVFGSGTLAFSLPGAPPEGIHFTLQPGEKRAFTVAFKPTAAGLQSGYFQIVRDDGTQTDLMVALSGRGTASKK
jgi:hypothetical protein